MLDEQRFKEEIEREKQAELEQKKKKEEKMENQLQNAKVMHSPVKSSP